MTGKQREREREREGEGDREAEREREGEGEREREGGRGREREREREKGGERERERKRERERETERQKERGPPISPASCIPLLLLRGKSLNPVVALSSSPYRLPSGKRVLVCRREVALVVERVSSRTVG